MNTTPAALQAHSDNTRTIGESDLLPRHPIFYTRDLEHATYIPHPDRAILVERSAGWPG